MYKRETFLGKNGKLFCVCIFKLQTDRNIHKYEKRRRGRQGGSQHGAENKFENARPEELHHTLKYIYLSMGTEKYCEANSALPSSFTGCFS